MVANAPLNLPDLTNEIKAALQQWNDPYRSASPLMDLMLFRAAHARQPTLEASARLSINQVLLDGLESFDSANRELANILKARFADDLSVQAAANRFNVVPGTIQKKQRLGWEELARVIDAKERTLRTELRTRMLDRLELPTYTQLWGVAEHIKKLAQLFTDRDGPSIIAIEGIGGIGKTSLANGLMRHLIETDVIGHGQFAGCAWVTSRQTALSVGGKIKATPKPTHTNHALVDGICAQLFAEEGRPIGLEPEQLLSMLKYRLAEQPHLIVVDNLETLEDVDALVETLRQLVKPTRILVTTRHNLFNEPDIFHFHIPPLSEAYALDLVRTEARQRNLSLLADASDDDLRPIYETVGGNPLALRLVVGQTHVHALHDVLADLTAARGKPIEKLYTHIYWQAWNSLDEPAREAWLLMPIANGEGLDLKSLAEIAEIDPPDLRNALDQLVTLNLVDRRGDLSQSRYTIHPLTRTFLQNQVLKWGAS